VGKSCLNIFLRALYENQGAGIWFGPAGLSKKSITLMADRRIAAGERACAHERVIMSSQPSSFRRTDVKGAMQAMQAAGLKIGRVELQGSKVLIIPAGDEEVSPTTATTASIRSCVPSEGPA
jgi:hypothetical protein